jgi:hypothetical protein
LVVLLILFFIEFFDGDGGANTRGLAAVRWAGVITC